MYREVESYVDLKSTLNQFEIIMIYYTIYYTIIQFIIQLYNILYNIIQ